MDTNASTAAQATTPTENAVVFINSEVLAPPEASPMSGVSKMMIDQATGMMVQDLQSFLKGFEQVGLIALSRLANNILTYGTYFHDPSAGAKTQAEDPSVLNTSAGNDAIRDLFNIIGDYAAMKTKISSMTHPSDASINENQNNDAFHDYDSQEKKNN